MADRLIVEANVTAAMSVMEAELVIAVLTYAEQEAAVTQHDTMSRVIQDLRRWRSSLLQEYLQHVGASHG